MKKLLAGLAVAALVVQVVFCAGTKEEASKGQVELQLWHRWAGTNAEYLQKVVDAFEAKNPDIKITVTSQPGEYFPLLQKMIADLAAGKNPPDLFLGGYNLMDYIGSELKPDTIEDLAPTKDEYQTLRNRFSDSIWGLCDFNGQEIGLPFAISNPVMYVNMDIFKASGLTEADIPTTWEDVKKVGEIIKAKTGKYAIVIQKGDTWVDQALITSNGGKFLTDDGKSCAFNNPEAEAALQMWQDFCNIGFSPIATDEEAGAMFMAGDIAMQITTIMRLANYRDSTNLNFVVAKLPGFAGKPVVMSAGGSFIACFAKGKNKAAAWRFLDYASSDEAQEIFTKTGYLSSTNAKVSVQPGQEAAYAQMPNVTAKFFCWPGGSKGLEMERLYINARTEILNDNAPVKKTLDNLANVINGMLK